MYAAAKSPGTPRTRVWGEELRRHNATTAIKGLTQQRDFSSRLKGVM